MKRILTLLFAITLITSCSNLSPKLKTESEDAQVALINFLNLLNDKRYEEAVSIYGGSYEGLQGSNPIVDPADHAQLMENACETNGYHCFPARTATFKERQGDTFIFQVEFNNPDGTLFVRGPCCGGNATDFPPEWQFEYRIIKTSDGKYLVMDLPPYAP